jgi:GT2 family glycosyltransferase
MSHDDVTIAVVPRERFSHTAATLESIYEYTPQPFKLVYVDGGSPSRVARYLQQQASARGFKLLRTDYYLSPNEGRNLAIKNVTTKYIVFVDNDVLVSAGWLEPLVKVAEETKAWIVGPLLMIGKPGEEVIHHGGGAARVEEVGGRRRFFEEHYLSEKRLEEVGALPKQRTGIIEFHCMLVNTECFEHLGLLDEQLLTMYEHIDLCMAVQAAGKEIYLEPRSIVSYVPSSPPGLSDLPYYFLRWSEDWNEATHRRFQTKWGLPEDDPFIAKARGWVTLYRQSPLWRLRPFVDRWTGERSYPIERRLLAPIEEVVCRFVANWVSRKAPVRAGVYRKSKNANQ